jgi:hypothetical protein
MQWIKMHGETIKLYINIFVQNSNYIFIGCWYKKCYILWENFRVNFLILLVPFIRINKRVIIDNNLFYFHYFKSV